MDYPKLLGFLLLLSVPYYSGAMNSGQGLPVQQSGSFVGSNLIPFAEDAPVGTVYPPPRSKNPELPSSSDSDSTGPAHVDIERIEVCSLSATNSNSADLSPKERIAERIVRIIMGQNNPQAARVLQERLEEIGTPHSKSGPISKKKNPEADGSPVRADIIEVLSQNEDDAKLAQDPEILHLLTELTINKLLEERQQVIEMEKSSSRWKKINGCLAAGASILTIIQWGIVIYQQIVAATTNDSSDCSCLFNNTMI